MTTSGRSQSHLRFMQWYDSAGSTEYPGSDYFWNWPATWPSGSGGYNYVPLPPDGNPHFEDSFSVDIEDPNYTGELGPQWTLIGSTPILIEDGKARPESNLEEPVWHYGAAQDVGSANVNVWLDLGGDSDWTVVGINGIVFRRDGDSGWVFGYQPDADLWVLIYYNSGVEEVRIEKPAPSSLSSGKRLTVSALSNYIRCYVDGTPVIEHSDPGNRGLSATECGFTLHNKNGNCWVDNWSADVMDEAPFILTNPTIAGSPLVPDTLTCSTGQLDGVPLPTFIYQWTRDGEDIAGETSESYNTKIGVDENTHIGCKVFATNSYGTTMAEAAPKYCYAAKLYDPSRSRAGAGWVLEEDQSWNWDEQSESFVLNPGHIAADPALSNEIGHLKDSNWFLEGTLSPGTLSGMTVRGLWADSVAGAVLLKLANDLKTPVDTLYLSLGGENYTMNWDGLVSMYVGVGAADAYLHMQTNIGVDVDVEITTTPSNSEFSIGVFEDAWYRTNMNVTRLTAGPGGGFIWRAGNDEANEVKIDAVGTQEIVQRVPFLSSDGYFRAVVDTSANTSAISIEQLSIYRLASRKEQTTLLTIADLGGGEYGFTLAGGLGSVEPPSIRTNPIVQAKMTPTEGFYVEMGSESVYNDMFPQLIGFPTLDAKGPFNMTPVAPRIWSQGAPDPVLEAEITDLVGQTIEVTTQFYADDTEPHGKNTKTVDYGPFPAQYGPNYTFRLDEADARNWLVHIDGAPSHEWKTLRNWIDISEGAAVYRREVSIRAYSEGWKG